ncbi:sortase domain-containing protein [Streptomyces olivochromogenes]|uniref:sortase domain-containing protein n=1 Tax=Streptomyces olivochromogenes TaxID=1963 RepID=UPI001F440322|nr:sortase [Streptomyces olivochromogenes]MCF3133796.1 sortase [Streptomyces olivochromogenes]
MTSPGIVAQAPSDGGSLDDLSRGEPARVRQTRSAGPGVRVLGVALSILGALLLGFVLDVGPLGDLRHARDRQVDYAALRGALANGVAPVGGAVRPGTPVAVLDVPALHLREVVREGTTAKDLARGPGHRRDTPLPGQAGVSVVMGRQTTFGGPFLHLRELRPGLQFTMTTGQGRHTFRVIGLRRAGDPQPPAPAAGHGRLTLVTADGTPFMPRGILRVDADLVSQVQAAGAPGVTPGALPEDETPMGVQRSAWLPLVLWGQALLAAAAAVAWTHARWGRRPTWVVGVPLLGALGLTVADQAAQLLPNLM